jgi:hypothetical protein
MEAHYRSLKCPSGARYAIPGDIVAHPEAVEANLGVVEANPRAAEASLML